MNKRLYQLFGFIVALLTLAACGGRDQLLPAGQGAIANGANVRGKASQGGVNLPPSEYTPRPPRGQQEMWEEMLSELGSSQIDPQYNDISRLWPTFVDEARQILRAFPNTPEGIQEAFKAKLDMQNPAAVLAMELFVQKYDEELKFAAGMARLGDYYHVYDGIWKHPAGTGSIVLYVGQSASWVSPQGLSFDFSFSGAMPSFPGTWYTCPKEANCKVNFELPAVMTVKDASQEAGNPGLKFLFVFQKGGWKCTGSSDTVTCRDLGFEHAPLPKDEQENLLRAMFSTLDGYTQELLSADPANFWQEYYSCGFSRKDAMLLNSILAQAYVPGHEEPPCNNEADTWETAWSRMSMFVTEDLRAKLVAKKDLLQMWNAGEIPRVLPNGKLNPDNIRLTRVIALFNARPR